jgi:hypothetical protein
MREEGLFVGKDFVVAFVALLRGFEGEIVFFEPKVACKPLAIR